MNHNDLDKRVMQLEQFHAEQMTAIGVLTERYNGMNDQLEKVAEILVDVRDKVMTWRECPAPGMCMGLNEQIKAINDDVASLKANRAMVVNGWKALGVIAGTATAISGAMYGLWKAVEYLVHGRSHP